MDTVAYNSGWDDAVADKKPLVRRTGSGKFKLAREVLVAIEDEEEREEYAESYLAGFNAANSSQAW